MPEIEVVQLLQGFPGKSRRGFFGWCTVSLLKGETLALFDTGYYTDRNQLLEALQERDIKPEDIGLIILSHLHYDHCLNITLFPNAAIAISAREMAYAFEEDHRRLGDIYIPDGLEYLLKERKVVKTADGDEILPGVRVLETPGHTPGSISLIVRAQDQDIVLAADTIKNAWEFYNRSPMMSFAGIKQARESIERLANMGQIIVPGHDRRFRVLPGGKVEFLEGLKVPFYVYLDPEQKTPAEFTVTG